MKVLVLWEDPREQHEAENLANVLANLAPQLATARVDKHGGVEIVHSQSVAIPNVNVRATSLRDAPPGTPEHAAYVEALERAVFKTDSPQPGNAYVAIKPSQFAEYRICRYMACSTRHYFEADTEAEIAQQFSDAGWGGEYCPVHRHMANRPKRGGSNVHR